jgi:hypothetical protein
MLQDGLFTRVVLSNESVNISVGSIFATLQDRYCSIYKLNNKYGCFSIKLCKCLYIILYHIIQVDHQKSSPFFFSILNLFKF